MLMSMRTTSQREQRFAEMRKRQMETQQEKLEPPTNSGLRLGQADDHPLLPDGKIWRLKDAARELGVNYETARRLFITQGVMRFSTGGNELIVPGQIKKRRVKMTYLITTGDIERLKKKMRGGGLA